MVVEFFAGTTIEGRIRQILTGFVNFYSIETIEGRFITVLEEVFNFFVGIRQA